MAEATKEVKASSPMNGVLGVGPSLGEQISEAERELVLQNFALLKQRAASGRDGEMRVAARRDPRSGVVEVTYCGVTEKADLEALRTMYAKLRQGSKF